MRPLMKRVDIYARHKMNLSHLPLCVLMGRLLPTVSADEVTEQPVCRASLRRDDHVDVYDHRLLTSAYENLYSRHMGPVRRAYAIAETGTS